MQTSLCYFYDSLILGVGEGCHGPKIMVTSYLPYFFSQDEIILHVDQKYYGVVPFDSFVTLE